MNEAIIFWLTIICAMTLPSFLVGFWQFIFESLTCWECFICHKPGPYNPNDNGIPPWLTTRKHKGTKEWKFVCKDGCANDSRFCSE